jgi:ABC-type antimicrobial peptide transport system permease subunit
MVVGQGILLAAAGVGVGLAAAFAVTRIMSSLLFETSPVDPLTYAVASAGLLASAAIASYLSAHRASSVNPVEALRME